MLLCWTVAAILSQETAEFGTSKLLNTKKSRSVQGKENCSGAIFLSTQFPHCLGSGNYLGHKSKQTWGCSKLSLGACQNSSQETLLPDENYGSQVHCSALSAAPLDWG